MMIRQLGSPVGLHQSEHTLVSIHLDDVFEKTCFSRGALLGKSFYTIWSLLDLQAAFYG